MLGIIWFSKTQLLDRSIKSSDISEIPSPIPTQASVAGNPSHLIAEKISFLGGQVISDQPSSGIFLGFVNYFVFRWGICHG